MRQTGFSLTKITNLASCLMTVLLALDIHSLAAQINQPGGQSPSARAGKTGAGPADGGATGKGKAGAGESGTAKPGAGGGNKAGAPGPGRKRIYMNHLQGWNPVNGLMEDDPATGQKDEEPPDPRVQQAEQGLSGELAAHRQAMRHQAEALQRQRQTLEAEQKELDEKLQALGRNASELSAKQEQRRKDVEAGIARLAHVYEQMPPRDAAAMFNVLDMRVMVPVAQHMIPRRISDVIGNMQPDRANVLSQYLAGIRKLSPDAISRMNSPTDYNIGP